jgi:hypothetical protein
LRSPMENVNLITGKIDDRIYYDYHPRKNFS